jgi:hypothetical protein
MVRPALAELVTTVLLAQDGVGPPSQPSQLPGVGVAVQAEPVGGGGPARCGRVERLGDALSELLESAGQVQVAGQPGRVEPFVDQRDLAAQGGDLYGEVGEGLAEGLGGRFSLLSDPEARFYDLGPGYHAARIDSERRKRRHIANSRPSATPSPSIPPA